MDPRLLLLFSYPLDIPALGTLYFNSYYPAFHKEAAALPAAYLFDIITCNTVLFHLRLTV